MTYLHSRRIVFRDLKPDNVGFDGNGVLKLFDFGLAAGLPRDGALHQRSGTPRYMAPEVGLCRGYGTGADVYSFGVLLWELCAWTRPLPHISTLDEFEREVFVGGRRPAIKGHWPTTTKDLIRSCWSHDANERPTMLDIKCSLSLEIFNIHGEEYAPQ